MRAAILISLALHLLTGVLLTRAKSSRAFFSAGQPGIAGREAGLVYVEPAHARPRSGRARPTVRAPSARAADEPTRTTEMAAGGQSASGGTAHEIGMADILAWGNRPPGYPPQALQRWWEGEVKLKISFAEDGHAREVDLVKSSGYRCLDEAARASATLWRKPPAAAEVASIYEVRVEFKIVD